ncbi:hypothetical protein AB0O77_25430 [Streptomyces albidoflavus]|uniref:hypothetical protein n=1 Tax=Streptomyces albidoflavus TaxID=1886 RepID=UPI003414BF2E
MTTIPAPRVSTRYTLGIIRLAADKDLRPAWGLPHGNSSRIRLKARGPHGPFGSITVGRRSGKVLRAEVIPYTGAAPRRAEGAAAVRALLASLPRATCPARCPAPTPAACIASRREVSS